METQASQSRYARMVDISRRVRWDIEDDVIRGRRFDYGREFLPGSLSLVKELEFLSAEDQRLLSQVQGRTYAYLFGLVERFIGAKVLDVSKEHWLGDQVALEALVRMTDEELKHQEMFRRLEKMMIEDMPLGYRQVAEANAVATAVLDKTTWAVLALTLHIELFTQAHYRASIDPAGHICDLWKDVFKFHWKEEAQHAVLDELELIRENGRLSEAKRDDAVQDFIDLVGAVDGLLQAQAQADTEYFKSIVGARYTSIELDRVQATILKAYRWQYIMSGAMEPRFQKVLFGILNDGQAARVKKALEPLSYAVPSNPDFALPMAA